MSSGGISYDCLKTSRKFTLPSVESWGTNMNIIKDPNKGIFTTRKEKVGDTQNVLLAQEASGDRIAENINVYARGVNPMVSVSYDNYSNNGGSRSSNKPAAHLPYKPERFIPPMYRQEDLMPLSRQPREWFYAFTNPELPNVIQEMKCPEKKSCIQDKKLNVRIPGNKQYNKELPLNYEKDPVSEIKESFHAENVNAQQSDPSRGTFQDTMKINNSKINHNKKVYDAMTNKSGVVMKENRGSVNLQKNIHNNLLKQVVNTKKTKKGKNMLEPDVAVENIKKKNLLKYNVKSNYKKDLNLNPIDSHDSNSNGIIDDPLHTDAITSQNDSTSLKYLPQFIPYDQTRNEVKDDIIQFPQDSGVYSVLNEKPVSTELEPNRTIVEPLSYSHSTHKINPSVENIRIDPSNITTKQTICIPVGSSKSKNIHRQVTPIDVDTISVKKTLLTSADTYRSPGEKESYIGEKPYREARALKAEYNSKSFLEDTKEFYDIQDTSMKDIENKNIDRGSFDPKPQGIVRQREHLDKNNDSAIDYRYKSLQNNVQNQFNQRYFDTL